jgi:hypothetical protein
MSLCSFNADMNHVKKSILKSVAGFTLLDEKKNGKVSKLRTRQRPAERKQDGKMMYVSIFSHIRLCLASNLFPSGFLIKILRAIFISPTRITCPTHLIPLSSSYYCQVYLAKSACKRTVSNVSFFEWLSSVSSFVLLHSIALWYIREIYLQLERTEKS